MDNDVELVREIRAVEADMDALGDNLRQWITKNPRLSLTMDMLASMSERRMTLEARSERTFDDGQGPVYAWIFTISGALHGSIVNGFFLGGSPAIVLATTEQVARGIAAEGLHSTLEAARRHYYETQVEKSAIVDAAGHSIVAGGRKAKGAAEEFGIDQSPQESRIGAVVTDILKRGIL